MPDPLLLATPYVRIGNAAIFVVVAGGLSACFAITQAQAGVELQRLNVDRPESAGED